MGNIDISGTSYEIPNLPRAQELVDVFQSLDSTVRGTYDDKVVTVLSNGSDLSNKSLRDQTNYKSELQSLIDEIRSAIINPNRSPATSRATTQEVIEILNRRSDKSSPLIRGAITRLSNIDLSDVMGLSDGERDEVSLELGELLLLIQSDTSDARKTQIHEQVDEIKNLYDEYIADRDEITRRATIETTDGNFELMLDRARKISLDGRIDKTDWDEVLPRINQEFNAMGIEVSTQDTEKIQNFINAIKKASESASVGLYSVDLMLENMLSQAEGANRTGPIDITINENTFAGLASTYIGEDPWVYARNFMHNLFPDRVDAGATGSEFTITFENREQVVELVSGIKSELSELQEFDAIDTVADVVFTALYWTAGAALSGIWALDGLILDVAIADFNLSTAAGGAALVASLPLHVWGVWAIKNKLRLANSGVSTEIIQGLTNNLRETIKLYQEAGFKPEEIRNLKTLLDSITLNLPETPAGINDLQFRTRYVYIQLQKWRGNPIMDQVRFSAAELGRIIDRDFRITPTAHIPAGGARAANYTGNFAGVPGLRSVLASANGIPIIGAVTRTFERYVGAHLWLGSLGARLINKGPDGVLGGWRGLYTKSESISDYGDQTARANRRTRQIFDIIDGIEGFTTDERTALKRQITEVYGGGSYSKLDPLRMYNYELSLLGGSERTDLYIELEAELSRDGIVMKIESPQDFHRGMRSLSSESSVSYRRLLQSFVSIPRIRVRTDDQAANILRDAIREKLGYVPEGLQGTIRGIRENTRKFEAQREAVEKARVEFMRFVDFYPLISDEQETRLTSIANTEKNTAETPELFRSNMERILRDDFALEVSSREISDFLKKAETESMRMGENRNNAKIIEGIEEIIRLAREKGYITPIEYTERLQTTRDFFQGNKTFWQPHLGLIIEDIYLRGTVSSDGIHTISEVQSFIDRGGSRDVYTYIRNMKREASGLDPADSTRDGGDSTRGEGTDEIVPTEDDTRIEPVPVESESTLKPGNEFLGRNSNLGRGYEAFRIELGMNPNININPDDFFAEILSQNYDSRENVILAMNEKLTTEGIHIQIKSTSAIEFGELQRDYLTYNRAMAEDIYTRFQLANGNEINERVIGAIQNSDNPFDTIKSIELSNIPEWDEIDRITLSPDELNALKSIHRGGWRTDGALNWRTILDNIRKAAT